MVSDTITAQADHLSVTGLPSGVTAGTGQSVTVTALDASNRLVPGYTGTIHFTSNDNSASLPADYTFTAADQGSHTFTGGVTLTTAGPQTVSATDVATRSITGAQTTT